MKTVKIFLSSTFADMEDERGALSGRMLRRLQQEVGDSLGVRVEVIDLRWGVTESQAREGRVIDLCLDAIEDARPYFVCLLGGRYGWVPPPPIIPQEDYSKLAREVAPKLLSEYYTKVDDLHHRLKPGLSAEQQGAAQRLLASVHYPLAQLSATEWEVRYVLSKAEPPRTIRNLERTLARGRVRLEAATLTCIHRSYRHEGGVARLLPGLPESQKMDVRRALDQLAVHPRFHTLFLARDTGTPDQSGWPQRYFDSLPLDQRASLQRLARHIEQSTGSWPVPYTVETLVEDVARALCDHMRANPELQRGSGDESESERENRRHEDFGIARLEAFCGREPELEAVARQVREALGDKERGRYLLLTGESGVGKSALMGALHARCAADHPGALRMTRFCGGASARSTSPRNLLLDAIEMLRVAHYVAEPTSQATSFADLQDVFRNGLLSASRAEAGPPVLILLDGVDQLQLGSHGADLTWLPAALPARTCIVVSMADAEATEPTSHAAGRATLAARNAISCRLERLTPEARAQVISSYLRSYHQTLPQELIDGLSHKQDAGNPLYLRVALGELRLLGKYESLDALIDELPQTVEGLFASMLTRLEADLGTVFQRAKLDNLFPRFMGLIAAGLHGLAEEDLRLLLGEWQRLGERDAHTVRLNDFLWSELLSSLRHMLVLREDEEAGNVVDFYHRQLRHAVERKYLGTPALRRQAHQAIAHYLVERGMGHITTLRDAPRYLDLAEEWDKLWETLRRPDFLEEKARRLSVYELLEDFGLGSQVPNTAGLPEAVKDIRHALALEAANVAACPTSILQQLCNVLHLRNEPALREACQTWEQAFRDRHPLDVFFSIRYRPTVTFEGNYRGIFEDRLRRMSSVRRVGRSRDGAWLYAVSDDRSLRIWSLATGQLLKFLDVTDTILYSDAVQVSDSLVVVGRADGSLLFFDLAGETSQRVPVSAATVSRLLPWDGERLVVACADGDIWRVDHGQGPCRVEAIAKLSAAPLALARGQDNILWIFTQDGTLWSGSCDPESLHPLRSWPGAWVAASLSPAAGLVATGHDEVQVWSASTGEALASIKTPLGATVLSFDPRGQRLAVGNGAHQIVVYSTPKLGEVCTLSGHHGPPLALAWGDDSAPDSLISGGADGGIRSWRVEQRDRFKDPEQYALFACTIVDQAGFAISGAINSDIWSWSLESGHKGFIYQGHRSTVRDLAVDHGTGQRFVSAGADGKLALWECHQVKPLRTFEHDGVRVLCCDVLRDGQLVVAGDGNGRVTSWQMDSGRLLVCRQLHDGPVLDVRVSPDGRRLVSAGHDGLVKISDVATLASLSSFRHHAPVHCAQLIGDSLLVSAGEEWVVYLWDVATGKRRREVLHHEATITDLAACPSGTHLFTVSHDRSLRCWDLASVALRGRYQNHSAIKTLSFDPTGLLAIGDVSGKLHVFDLRGNLDTMGLVPSRYVSPEKKLALIPLLNLFDAFQGDEPPERARAMIEAIERRIGEALQKREILPSQTPELDEMLKQAREHYQVGG